MSSVNGYYSVNNKLFDNKIHALIKGSELNIRPEWHYFDEVFNKASRDGLGEIPLTEWYKQRALQLREKYDYLILNYSGGSDSHNILHTFLKNNIKLDHIFVQWHTKLADKGLYTVNNIDKSNANFHSEWDLVLKKDLEWLAQYHPDIKIELSDWTDKLDKKFYNDDLFNTNAGVTPNISRGLKLHTFSETERTLSDKGLSVGSIFGVDKPSIIEKDNICYFYFNDKSCMAQSNPNNPDGLEYFYISPDLPQLTIEQSHRLMQWFSANPEKRYLIKAKSQRPEPNFNNWPLKQHYAEYENICDIAKLVCYPYWDFNRFQAGKPVPGQEISLPSGFKLWDAIMLNIPEFKNMSDVWQYHWKSYVNVIDEKYLRGGEPIGLNSKWHYLGKFNND